MLDIETTLQNYGQERKVLKNEHVFHSGQDAKSFYLLKKGKISLYKLNSAGKEIEIRNVLPYEFFAEVIIFAEEKYPVTAIATEESFLIEYSKNKILEVISKDYELGLFFIKLLASRCLLLNKKIHQISLQNVSSRLSFYLVEYIDKNNLYKEAQQQTPIELNVSKNEIANSINTISETLSRTFKKLHKLNILKVFGKTIVIQDYNKLKSLAEE
jgi:CRP/FNR family transcriptional regulator, dissimilatory nitrate respiration regulator